MYAGYVHPWYMFPYHVQVVYTGVHTRLLPCWPVARTDRLAKVASFTLLVQRLKKRGILVGKEASLPPENNRYSWEKQA